jgi:hypothetical protein
MYNLKDPRDLDEAYRLQFNGGWTHNSNGIRGDGSTGNANTFAAINTVAIPNRLNHWSSYNRTLSTSPSSGSYNGILQTSGGVRLFGFSAANGGSYVTGLQSFDTTGISTSPGFLNGTVISNSAGFFYRNGSYIYESTPSSITTQFNYYLGSVNQNNTITNFNNTNIAFASLGGALTATDAANFYTLVQAFQTTLGRQV